MITKHFHEFSKIHKFAEINNFMQIMTKTFYFFAVLQLSHVKERPYICVEKGCEKTFGFASCLKNHLKMHSGVKPFSCQKCEGSWFQKGNYERHNCKSLQLKKIPCRQAGCEALFKNVKTSITHYKNFHA